MFFSRHQLQQALLALDGGTACAVPRRVDKKERWDDDGAFQVVQNPAPEFTEKNGRPIRTNVDPRPDPHGRAFLTVDPKTYEVRCAACATRGGK